MTILHKEYSYKILVFMKSCVYHSICMVFTILFVGSLSSHIYGLNCHYLYWNIDYIFIFRICGLYLAASKVSTFPCPLKVNNGSQWWVFWQKWRKVSTKKCLKTNLYRKRNFYPRYLSKKLKWFSIFLQQILKRNLRKKRISEEKSLPNKFQ